MVAPSVGEQSKTAWRDQIVALAAAERASEGAAQLVREIRDELICEARRAGCSSREIADWAALSQSRVCVIAGG